MKRDMDLIKAILLELEKNTPGTSYESGNFVIDGYTPEQVHFHLYLMAEAGLIYGQDMTTFGSPTPEVLPFWMTWHGYEFLDAARNEGVWDRAKGVLQEKGLGMTFDIMKALLLSLARNDIGMG